MMKKSLCLLLVLGLIAQICAKPTDDDKGKDKAKDGVEKEAKGAVDKMTKEGKGLEGKAKGMVDEVSKKGKSAAHHGNQADDDHHKQGQGHHGPVSKMMNGMEKVGEKVLKTGTDTMTGFLGIWGL